MCNELDKTNANLLKFEIHERNVLERTIENYLEYYDGIVSDKCREFLLGIKKKIQVNEGRYLLYELYSVYTMLKDRLRFGTECFWFDILIGKFACKLNGVEIWYGRTEVVKEILDRFDKKNYFVCKKCGGFHHKKYERDGICEWCEIDMNVVFGV